MGYRQIIEEQEHFLNCIKDERGGEKSSRGDEEECGQGRHQGYGVLFQVLLGFDVNANWVTSLNVEQTRLLRRPTVHT